MCLDCAMHFSRSSLSKEEPAHSLVGNTQKSLRTTREKPETSASHSQAWFDPFLNKGCLVGTSGKKQRLPSQMILPKSFNSKSCSPFKFRSPPSRPDSFWDQQCSGLNSWFSCYLFISHLWLSIENPNQNQDKDYLGNLDQVNENEAVMFMAVMQLRTTIA